MQDTRPVLNDNYLLTWSFVSGSTKSPTGRNSCRQPAEILDVDHSWGLGLAQTHCKRMCQRNRISQHLSPWSPMGVQGVA